MRSSEWIALLEIIPPHQKENLLVTLGNGKELAIQGILRIDESYLVIRGRVMGSSDVGGGFFFVPYDQIVNLGFQRPVSEAEVLSILGEAPPRKPAADEADAQQPEPAEAAPAPAPAPAPAQPARAPAAAAAAAPPRPAAAAAAPAQTPKVSTADLLKKLRERRQGIDPSRPPSVGG
jgi:hypothetical protein